MLTGNVVALVTPMLPDGRIDETSFLELMEWHIGEKAQGIVVNGTTGESATTTPEEKERLLTLAIQQAKGRVPIIAGTGSSSTRASLEMTQQAQKLGADACLIVTPYYNKPTQAGLLEHYGFIARSVDIPIILYNVPGRTACDLKPETAAALFQKYANIVGIKEATGDLARVEQIKALSQRDVCLVSGDDATAFEFMKRGGHGVISVTQNVAPKAMQQWCALAQKGDWSAAQAINQTLMPLHQQLFIESNPIPSKWVLHKKGFIQRGIRLPLTWLSIGAEAPVQAAMQAAGI